METTTWLLILAACGAFFMAFNNGANDVSNAFACTVGSKALSMRKALVLGSSFTFLGAILLGGHVAIQLVDRLVDPGSFVDPLAYTLAMLAVLFSAGLFVLLSTLTGLPVSSTHSIVGSLMGVNLVTLGVGALDFRGMGTIILSWILSPILTGLVAFSAIHVLENYLFDLYQKRLKRKIQTRLPAMVAALAFLGITGILLSSKSPFLRAISPFIWVGASLLFAACIWGFLQQAVRRWVKRYVKNESILDGSFKKLQAWTACAVAFGNGANDVSNSISPVIAIVWVLNKGTFPDASDHDAVPIWVLLLGAGGIMLGILTLGHRVMNTLGRKITVLTPIRGFGIDLAVAIVVIWASTLGLPVSTTQAATGGVIGAGLAKGSSGLHIQLLTKIFLAWVVTVPFAACITILIYHIFLFLAGL